MPIKITGDAIEFVDARDDNIKVTLKMDDGGNLRLDGKKVALVEDASKRFDIKSVRDDNGNDLDLDEQNFTLEPTDGVNEYYLKQGDGRYWYHDGMRMTLTDDTTKKYKFSLENDSYIKYDDKFLYVQTKQDGGYNGLGLSSSKESNLMNNFTMV